MSGKTHDTSIEANIYLIHIHSAFVFECLSINMAKQERKTISIKRDTQRMLWQLKETPDDTYDEIIRDLMSEACDIEVYSDE